MRLRTRLITGAAVAGTLVTSLVPSAPAGAAPTPVLDDALAWLETQQEADGGFEVADFPGFETSDAIYAIAAASQTTETWSASEALAAVEAITHGTSGKDPLDAVDDWVDSVQATGDVAAKAQQAAKVMVLVTIPLGLDESDFDPSGDTEAPVDLLATLQAAAGTGAYSALTFGGRAYAAWALGALDEPVPAALTSGLAAGQLANGSFHFSGDPAETGYDNDLTATVIIGLVAGGVDPTSTTIDRAAASLGLQQRWNGEWAGVGDDGSPNSTGLVMQAAAALGSDPESSCWRDAADRRFIGLPYPSPTEALEARQAPDGHIVGPYDDSGVFTNGTSQAIQGLAAAEGRSRYEGAPEHVCSAEEVVGNRRTVHSLYVDLLVRLADPGGADYWTQRFDGGLSPAQMSQQFTGSGEYAGRVVERLYRQYLGRSAGPGERQAQSALITSGRRMELIWTLLASKEFKDNSAPVFPSGPATDETWAEAMLRAVVAREPRPADVQYVLDQLELGRTRVEVTRSILRTSEGRGVLVREIYRQLLRRDPSTADRAYWGGELGRGVSPEKLVTLISGSPEYRGNTL